VVVAQKTESGSSSPKKAPGQGVEARTFAFWEWT